MAGPTVLPGGQSGAASLAQGFAALQNAMQFLEQKRQFEVDQERLNRSQRALWGWNAVQELAKTTDRKSVKEVAAKYPDLFSMIFQQGLGLDSQESRSFTDALAASPDNDVEAMNRAFSIFTRYGSGEVEAKDAVSQSVAEMQSASQKQAQANQPVVPAPPAAEAGKTVQPPISMTPLGKTPGVPPEDTSLAQFKAKLQDLVGGMKVSGGILDPQQRQQVDSLVGQYVGKSPAVDAFMQKEMGSFVSTVINARGTLGEEGLLRGKTVAQPPQYNYPPYRQPPPPAANPFLPEIKTTSPTAGGVTPEPSLSPAATPVSQGDPVITGALQDFLSSTTDAGAGRVVVARKKLEGPMTTAAQAHLEGTPQGIKQLVEDANYLINDPQTARILALQQNAPAVYEGDRAASGDTTTGRYQYAKMLLELKKLGLEVDLAEVNLAKAGVEGKDAAAKAVVSGIMATMISSGLVFPAEVSSQLNTLSTKMSAEREAWNKATDEATKEFHAQQLNEANVQFQGIIAAYKVAVGQGNTPEAKKRFALLDTIFAPKQKSAWERLWNVGNELVRQSAAPAAAQTAPTMTQGGTAVGAKYGL